MTEIHECKRYKSVDPSMETLGLQYGRIPRWPQVLRLQGYDFIPEGRHIFQIFVYYRVLG